MFSFFNKIFAAWTSRWESDDSFLRAGFYRFVLGVGLAVSLILMLFSALFIWVNEGHRFTRDVSDSSAGVGEELFGAGNLMQSVRSFIHASDYVSPDEWKTFVHASSLREDLKQFKTLAWASRVPADRVSQFMREVRAGQRPGLQIMAPTPGDSDNWLIRYTDPMETSPEWTGRNLASETTFQIALRTILKNNQPLAICRNDLFPGSSPESRIILYLLPVYSLDAPLETLEARRKAIQGLIILEIDLDVLVSRLQEEQLTQVAQGLHVGLKFDDGMSEIHTDETYTDKAPASSIFESIHSIPLGASRLDLNYSAGSSYIKGFLWIIPPVVGLTSALISVLLSGIVWLLANTRARAEELARQMTEQVRLQDRALFAIHQGVILVDALARDLPIIYANRGFETITGYSREEVLGRNCRLLQGTNHDQPELGKIRVALREQKAVSVLLQNYRQDGSMFWNQVSISPVANDRGQVTHFVGVLTDVTENILKEQELRTARVEAENASRAKSEFLANMSHEIRTPMNGVIGMISLLQDTHLNNEQRDYVETVHQSGQALLRVINDILDFSKIESGKLELETSSFHLSECVEDAVLLFSKAAADKKIELSFLFHDHVPDSILGDETRLRQIILNLIGNAVKFTPAGEIFMEVEAEKLATPPVGEFSGQLGKVPAAGDWVRLKFSIRDTGEGIPADRLQSIFESFTQVDASTTRRHGGTGLGLAICKRLVEIMDGKIGAESNPGSGSTFHFEIIAREAPPADHPEPPKLEDLQGKMVLAVDDSPTNLRVLVAQLKNWKMEARTALSAQAALDLIREGFKPDLAILDYQMPEKNGAHLAAELRAHPLIGRLPLILLSSINDTSSIPKETETFFSSILIKPAKKSRLLQCIQKALAAPRPAGPATSPEKLGPVSPTGHGLILLVEDNKVNQQVGSLMLKKLGYDHEIASNGVEAVQKVQAKIYQTVLMDVQMPLMDGLEATRLIRKLSIPRPHIIAMTANAMSGDREKCLAAGMDNYISKPLRLQTLREALEHDQPIAS